MKMLTFIEYLTELTVSDDPLQAKDDLKRASKDPERYRREQQSRGVDDEKNIQANKDDPLKSEKLRVAKMKQQLSRNEGNLARKEDTMRKKAGV